MPKKIRFESAVHQFFVAADRHRAQLENLRSADANLFADWIQQTVVDYPGSQFVLSWSYPRPGVLSINIRESRFYVRGDRRGDSATVSSEFGLTDAEQSCTDPVESANAAFFDRQIQLAIEAAGLFDSVGAEEISGSSRGPAQSFADTRRKEAEADFHNEWASGVDVKSIDVRAMNEACTAPEMRYIRSQLGDMRGRKLLDVGCGLGEASVYFAMEGASVTASDISQGMLDVASRLAEANGVSIETMLSASEDLALRAEKGLFDIIYIGNTLHHVAIDQTLSVLLPLLKRDGLFVSWDPLAYNPVINVYRRVATEVRTVDEHPFRLADLRILKKHFKQSHTRYFWFFTLVIFLIMAIVQRRSPNKERFWKKVVEEANTWAWIYTPLQRVDNTILTLLPFLRPLCWNVVFIGRGPKPQIAPTQP